MSGLGTTLGVHPSSFLVRMCGTSTLMGGKCPGRTVIDVSRTLGLSSQGLGTVCLGTAVLVRLRGISFRMLNARVFDVGVRWDVLDGCVTLLPVGLAH